MTLTVLKPFPHPSRRFSVGQEITEIDLIGGAIPVADLKKGRFIASSETRLADAAVEKAEAAEKAHEAVEPLHIPDGATAAQIEASALMRDSGKGKRA